MDFTFQNIVIIALVLFTGLSAGLCFTWSNAVTPGIGRLDDFGYLQSFQQMNRTILNPVFFVVFFGPFFLNLVTIYLFKSSSNTMVVLLITAAVIYFFGLILITIFGNVPLNEMLDKVDLSTVRIDELRHMREKFELKWNRWHSIRTLSAILSFILLLVSLMQSSKMDIQ